MLIPAKLSQSVLPIAFFTGVTCKFWTHITSPFPTVSKVFDGIGNLALSPIWLVESIFNTVTGPLFRASPLKTEIPLNVSVEIASGTGLTCEKLTHTVEFVKKMTQNW